MVCDPTSLPMCWLTRNITGEREKILTAGIKTLKRGGQVTAEKGAVILRELRR